MLTSVEIKQIKNLADKKARHERRLFVAEGEKICKELFESHYRIEKIYALESWITEHGSIAENVTEINEKELERISFLKHPNKVLAVVQMPNLKPEIQNLKDNITLVLDAITDPGNMGTIIRTADWFGIKNIICSPQTVDVYNPKVVQAAMGSLFRLNLIYMSLTDFLGLNAKQYNIPVFGAHLNGSSLYTVKLPPSGFLIIGSESHGISSELEKFTGKKITIPLYGKKTESLNAGVATAIILSEWKRQLMIKP